MRANVPFESRSPVRILSIFDGSVHRIRAWCRTTANFGLGHPAIGGFVPQFCRQLFGRSPFFVLVSSVRRVLPPSASELGGGELAAIVAELLVVSPVTTPTGPRPVASAQWIPALLNGKKIARKSEAHTETGRTALLMSANILFVHTIPNSLGRPRQR